MASFFSNTLLGSYTTPDSIDDLLLRVALRRRAGPGEAPLDCVPEARPDDRAATLEELVALIPWQQKRFSPAELVRYAAAAAMPEGEGCSSVRESPHRDYVVEVKKRLEVELAKLNGEMVAPRWGGPR